MDNNVRTMESMETVCEIDVVKVVLVQQIAEQDETEEMRYDKEDGEEDLLVLPTITDCCTEKLMMNNEDITIIEQDTTVHAFNLSANTTCIEKELESSPETDSNVTTTASSTTANNKQTVSCEGSDSGVEVIESTTDRCILQRTHSTNSANFQEFDASMTPARSCDSSIISCCSNYEEAYNLLARRNSTLLEDYKLRNSDGTTSEGGSESSSVLSTKNSKRNAACGVKKKVALNDNNKSTKTPPSSLSSSASSRRAKLLNYNKTSTSIASNRAKSTDRLPPKTPINKSVSNSNAKMPSKTRTVPDNLPLTNSTSKKDAAKKTPIVKTNAINRTPIATPSDDGRWPSINSKPAPLLAKNVQKRMMANTSVIESKSTALEKYATLPRRRKERSADSIKDTKKLPSRENSIGRTTSFRKQIVTKEPMPQKTLPPYPRKKPKTKIYHETSVQTALTIDDIAKALNGLTVQPLRPQDVEKCDQEVQADRKCEELDKIKEQHEKLTETYEKLKAEHEEEKKLRFEAEARLKCELIEKDGLKEELKQNSDRVLAILASDDSMCKDDDNTNSDSLMVLEDRFHNVSQVVIKQEEEISKLNECCRSLQRDLEKSLAAQKILLQQQQDLEAESIELQEFMQAEKGTLSETIKELESESKRYKLLISQKEKEFEVKQDEYKRISDQRRHENMSLQAKLGVLEGKCRELLVHQGSTMSGAAVALSALISRLDGLVEELVTSYSISDQELEEVIFHNEAYSHSGSSTDATPEKSKKFFVDKTPSPKGRGSTFVAAVINAIKNAAAQTPFSNRDISKDNLCTDNSDSIEMLDSETEPCLMMEHVLEDVVIPDGHSHNMISSCHSMINSRLTHSESLNNLTQSYYGGNNSCKQLLSEQISFTESLNVSFTSDSSEYVNSVSVVDQVIEVDNLITRLLKVIRIIELENEDCMNSIEEERDAFSQQVDKQKEKNKIVVKQLKDWEVLGASLKGEVKELIHRLTKKNDEINDIKCELNQQRHEVEKLNQDVCDLSTALSKTELELRTRDDAISAILKEWEQTGERPIDKEELAKLVSFGNQVQQLKDTITQREKQLAELTQEYSANKEVLYERWNETVKEAKKLYEAIDNALETLQGIQSVVQNCAPLAKLQRDLEETNFRSASGLPLLVQPPDCNANAALLQAIANLGVTTPINSTA